MATLVYSLNANNSASYPGTGSSWFDVSGNTYSTSPTMTLVNNPTFVDAGTYRYLRFTKAAFQYGQFAMAAVAAGAYPSTTLAYRIWDQSFSVAMWVRLDSTPSGLSATGGTSGSGVDPQCLTTMQRRHEVGGDNLAPLIYCGGPSGGDGNQWAASWMGLPTSPGAALSVGIWHHVVAVYESVGSVYGTLYFYIDGVLVGTQVRTTGGGFGTTTYEFTNALTVYLNHSYHRPAPYPYPPPDSTVGDVSFNSYQIYQGALSAGEVSTLYSGGYTNPSPANQRGVPPELGLPVTTRQFSWNEMARRAWGSEFSAPDHRVYEFSNGRGFDSTDRGDTGFYEPPST